MRLIKSSILLIFLLLSVFTVYSQESRKEIKLEYPVNKAAINRNHGTNMDQLSEMSSFLESIKNDSTVRIREVTFFGSASPEGSYQINHRLARARLNSLESAVCDELQIADSVIRHDDEYIPWGFLSEMVSESDIPQKQEVLDIINEEPILVDYAHGSQIDSRVLKLQKLDGGGFYGKNFMTGILTACVAPVWYSLHINDR